MKKLVALLTALAIGTPVWSATQIVTLVVPSMHCATCPITVKKALTRVDGVNKVEVILNKREAIVTFDDTKTSIQKLTKATEDAGYPADLRR